MIVSTNSFQRMRMNRATVALAVSLVGLLNAACSAGPVRGTVTGVEVSVESLQRMKEYKVPGSSEFGPIRPLHAGEDKEFVVVELKAPRKIEFGDKGIKAKVKDDKGQTYNSVYSEVFGFDDGRIEAKLLFEIPQHAALSILTLDDTSFDLSKVKD